MNVNNLLLWLSAKGSGSWARFRAALDELRDRDSLLDGEVEESESGTGNFPIHHAVRQNLERLGHAEFFRRDFPTGWRVVPPILASVSKGSTVVGFLCGARNAELMEHIERSSSVLQIEAKAQIGCPDRIQITAKDQSQVQQLADEWKIIFQPNAPRMLLAAVPPVNNEQLRIAAE